MTSRYIVAQRTEGRVGCSYRTRRAQPGTVLLLMPASVRFVCSWKRKGARVNRRRRHSRHHGASTTAIWARRNRHTLGDARSVFPFSIGLLLRRWGGCSTKAELENCRRLLHERDVRNSREDGQEVNALRARLAEKEEELAVRVAEHKRAVAKFRKENSSLQHEFEKARSAAKQSRARLAQTENELAIVRKRLQLAQSRPGTPADDGSNRTGRAGLADRASLF